jgi:hypothetical protein
MDHAHCGVPSNSRVGLPNRWGNRVSHRLDSRHWHLAWGVLMDWLNRLKEHLASMPAPMPKPELQTQDFHHAGPVTVRTVSTTQLGELAGIHLPSQLLKNLGIQPFAQTKNGCFWAVEDVPLIFLKLSKYFADKAREELEKS